MLANNDGHTTGLSPNSKTTGKATLRRAVTQAPVPAGMEEEIRHVEHPLRRALDMVCQHRKPVIEAMAKHRPYPRSSTAPSATMTSSPSSQPKGISPLRQGGYPLRGKGDIHFHARGISTFRQRGISPLAARRGDLRASFAGSGGIWQYSRNTTRRHNRA